MIITLNPQTSPAGRAENKSVGQARRISRGCGLVILAVCLICSQRLPARGEEPAAISPVLAQLQWIVGAWVHDSEGVVATMTVDWNDARRMVQREIEIKLGSAPALRIHQTITWDPVMKRLRSSSRSSDGSTSTGVWQVAGERISNTCEITYADGTRGASVNVWERDDSKQCVFTATGRVIGGQPQPDIAPTEFDVIPGDAVRLAVLDGR